MSRDKIVSFAVPLIRNGYRVIPIMMSGGGKSPPLVGSGYHDTEYTMDDAKEWREKFVGAGLALVCGANDVYSLDFDVDDPKIAKHLRLLIKKHWPDMLVRSCNPNRFATIFRAGEGLTLVKNGHSDKYKIGDKLNCIELSGKGLMTMYGVHRKTGNVYKWGSKLTPGKIKAHELVTLTLKDVQQILKVFNKLCANGGHTLVTDQRFTYRNDDHVDGGVLGDDGVVRDSMGWEIPPKTHKRFEDDKVDLILDTFHGDDRDTWLKMGMALHVNYQGDDVGFEKWDAWAQEYRGYVSTADCRSDWDGFDADKQNGITLASFWSEIRKKKQQEIEDKADVPRPKTLEDFEERFVFIQKGSKVADLEMRVNESILTVGDWKNSVAGISQTITTEDRTTGVARDRQVAVYKLWEKSPHRKQVYDEIYYPSNDRIVREINRGDRQPYYNTYSPPFIIPTDARDKLPLFLTHIKYLFPGEGDVEWMINWMAQAVQDPLTRYRVNPLSISTFHGTGRGWFGQVMTQLMGLSNVSTLQSIQKIISPNAKTGFLDGTTLCLVNETFSNTKDKYEINDRLRNLLGDNFQQVDVKYGSESSKFIFTRFMFQSNHVDAMALEDKDTRIEVFLNTDVPKPKAHYDELYALLGKDSDFIDQLHAFLMEQDVDASMLQESRRTAARSTMIKASKSPTGSGFYEFKQVVGEGVFTNRMMTKFLANYQVLNSPEYIPNPKEVSILKRDNIHSRGVINKKERPLEVMSFQSIDFGNMDERVIIDKINGVEERIQLFFKLTEKPE